MAEFQQTQYNFAAHLRDPDNQPAPDNIEDRRIAIYRDLIFNNINNTLVNAFPVIHAIVAPQEWQLMVRDFLIRHRCKTPLFVEIAREFILYLEQYAPETYPFITELAHYEYVELALSIDEHEFKQSHIDNDVDVLQLPLIRSPLAWLLVYRFPVHQLSVEHQPQQPNDSPVCLIVYRNADDAVKFIEINAVSARLLDLLQAGLNGYDAAQTLAEEMQHQQTDTLIAGAKTLITDWIQQGVLVIRTH